MSSPRPVRLGIERLEDRLNPVVHTVNVIGFGGDGKLSDGFADTGRFDPVTHEYLGPSGETTLLAAVQQAEHNFQTTSVIDTIQFAPDLPLDDLNAGINSAAPIIVKGGGKYILDDILIFGDGARVEGLTVKGGGIFILGNGAKVTDVKLTNPDEFLDIYGDGSNVARVTFTTPGGANSFGGVLVSGRGGTISHVTGAASIGLDGTGITLTDSSAFAIAVDGHKHTVSNNKLLAAGNGGIGASGEGEHTIQGNTVTGAEFDGIAINADLCKIIGNIVSGSGDSGIRVFSPGGLGSEITGKNTVTGSGSDGIFIYGAGHLVLNNTSTGNTGRGLRAASDRNQPAGGKVQVFDNTLSNNDGGFESVGVGDLTLHNNKAFGTTGRPGGGYTVVAAPDASVLATDNKGEGLEVLFEGPNTSVEVRNNEVDSIQVRWTGAITGPGHKNVLVADNRVTGPLQGFSGVSVGVTAGPTEVRNNLIAPGTLSVGVTDQAAGARTLVLDNTIDSTGLLGNSEAVFISGDRIDLINNHIGGGRGGPNSRAGGLFYGGNGGLIQANDIGRVLGQVKPNIGDGVILSGDGNRFLRNLVVSSTQAGVRVFGSGNTIGGPEPNDANEIGANGRENGRINPKGHGVVVEFGTQNTIRGNRIGLNGGRGIDLNGDGITPNDSGSFDQDLMYNPPDTDDGANGSQNHPVFSRVGTDGTVYWMLNSTPDTPFRIDFYTNVKIAVGDGRFEYGEGQFWLSTQTEKTNKLGRVEFRVDGLPDNGFGYITATATDPLGNTSELSLVDRDADGLADEWEEWGIDVDEDGTRDLTLDHARSDQKDVFVEVDYMVRNVQVPLAPASMAPVADATVAVDPVLKTNTVLDKVVKAFLDAPGKYVQNPNGADGVRLHVAIDHSPEDHVADDSVGDEGGLDVYKANHFGTPDQRLNPLTMTALEWSYRYCVFAFSLGSKETLGLSELYGNQLSVALGQPNFNKTRPASLWGEDQAATFMHELGHTLGLTHGGGGVNIEDLAGTADDRHIKYKPNYYSVMNYTWGMRHYSYLFEPAFRPHLSPGELNYANTFRLDYSREPLNPIHQGNLNEFDDPAGQFSATIIAPPGRDFPTPTPAVRIGGGGFDVPTAELGPDPFIPASYLHTPGQTPAGRWLRDQFVPMTSAVDWNLDQALDDSGVRRAMTDTNRDLAKRIDADDPLTVLQTYPSDWTLLRYNFRESPRFGPGSNLEEPGERTINDLIANAASGGADLAVRGTVTPDDLGGGEDLTYTWTVTNLLGGPAPNAVLTIPLPTGATFVSANTSRGTFTTAGGTLTASLGPLFRGDTAVVTLVLSPENITTISVTAQVESATFDLNPADNQATITLPPGPPPPPPGSPPPFPPRLPGAPAREFGVGAGSGSEVRFFNPDGTERFAADALPGTPGGVRTAAADFNADGVADLAVGTGPGGPSLVRILDGVTGAEVFSFAPFEPSFPGGVFVAAGDVTGDGVAELVVTPDQGGGPRIEVLRGGDFALIANYFAFTDDPGFRGGARAGVGDIDGDGLAEVVVSAGFQGGPRVATYDGRSVTIGSPQTLFNDFFIFEPDLRNGAYVTVGDVDGDGIGEIVGGAGPGGGPRVRAISGRDLLDPAVGGTAARQVANFFAGDVNNRAGIRVAVKDLDGDGRADVLVGDAGTSRVTGYLGRDFAGEGAPEAFGFDAFPGLTDGVFIG